MATAFLSCAEFDKWLSIRPTIDYGNFKAELLKLKNTIGYGGGIYIMYDKTEKGHGTNFRIVRIGKAKDLRQRLRQHFEGKIRNSVARLHIGKALFKKLGRVATEDEISAYIQENCFFKVIPIKEEKDRRYFEAKAIGTVSNCKDCGKSSKWLGNYSAEPKIVNSGLWNTQELYCEGLTTQDFEIIKGGVK